MRSINILTSLSVATCFVQCICAIYHGEIARIGQFPYQVSLVHRSVGDHICGGTIIGQRRVLTAGQCVELLTEHLDELAVKAGTVMRADTPERNPDALLAQVTNITVHPKRNVSKGRYDLALVTTDVDLYGADTRTRQPIAVAARRDWDWSKCVVSGWGDTEMAMEYSGRLRYAKMTMLSAGYCARKWRRLFGRDEVCAKGVAGRDAAEGDNGGPLVCDRQLVGVVLYGSPTTEFRMPAVYVNVWSAREWAIEGDASAISGHCDWAAGRHGWGGIGVMMVLMVASVVFKGGLIR